MRADDQAGVDNSHVIEFCILEYQWSNNRKVHIGSGELSEQLFSVKEDMSTCGKRAHSQVSAESARKYQSRLLQHLINIYLCFPIPH